MQELRSFLCTHRRFLALALLCITFTTLAAVFLIRSVFTPDTGLIRYDPEVVTSDEGVIFRPSAPASAVAAAGLLPDRDAILSLNGIPVRSTRDLVRAVASVTRFDPFPLVARRDTGEVVTLEVRPFFRPARIDWLFFLVFCLALVVTAFTVSWRLPQEESTLPVVLSALIMLVFTCVTPFSYESIPANALANLGNSATWLLVVFALFFPWKRGSRGLRAGIITAISLLYAGFTAVRTFLYALWMGSGREEILVLYRRVGLGVIVSDGLAYAVLLALLANAYVRSQLPRDRRMLEWMLAGILLALPPYFFLDQLPLILGGAAHGVGLGSLAQLFLAIPPIFLLIALTRQKPFNLRSFLTRYGVSAAFFAAVCALFGVLFMPLAGLIGSAYRLASPVPELCAAGLIMLPIMLVRAPIERVLFSRASRLRDIGGADEGLKMIVRQVSREDARAFHAQHLMELRAILRGVVHSIRQPVHLLAASVVPGGTPEQQESVARILLFLETLESLSGPSSAIRGAATLAAIVQGAIERVQPRFPGIRFQVVGRGEVRLSCYPEEVVRALCAVLENAAEAGAGQTAPVVIRTDANPARVLLEVTDGGPGINALTRRGLFRPFYTTKPGHQGLGLYSARIMVERNDGSIEVARGDSQGVAVRLAFPRDTAAGNGGTGG
jgi:signal transduction histidine kinase